MIELINQHGCTAWPECSTSIADTCQIFSCLFSKISHWFSLDCTQLRLIYCWTNACWCIHYIWHHTYDSIYYPYKTYYCVSWICCTICIRPTVQTREIWVLIIGPYYKTVITAFMNMHNNIYSYIEPNTSHLLIWNIRSLQSNTIFDRKIRGWTIYILILQMHLFFVVNYICQI